MTNEDLKIILEEERKSQSVPPKAVSIGINDKGEIIYVLHKDEESSKDARDRVKPKHTEHTWIDFEPANPGMSESLVTQEDPQLVVTEQDVKEETTATAGEPKSDSQEPSSTSSDKNLTDEQEEDEKKKKKKKEDRDKPKPWETRAEDEMNKSFGNSMNSNPIDRSLKGLRSEEAEGIN